MKQVVESPTADALLLREARDPRSRASAADLLVRTGHVAAQAGEIFVLCDAAMCPGDGPVGAAVVVPVELDGGQAMKLEALAIEPAFRGRGFGRRLFDDLSDVLRARGVRRLVFELEL